MHGVVILYNYYHRKQHRELEFLGFESFCKLILGFHPPLLEYMKFMRKSDDTELIDPEKQLSLVEKTIMDSCDLCMRLNASKDSPDIEGWAISEVIVFLVDSRKENCLLEFSSITEGVWSLIGKDVDISNQSPEGMPELKQYKKKRITKKPWRDDSGVNEDALQQLAFSSVREATGVNLVLSYTWIKLEIFGLVKIGDLHILSQCLVLSTLLPLIHTTKMMEIQRFLGHCGF